MFQNNGIYFEEKKCKYSDFILLYKKKYSNDKSYVFASCLNYIVVLKKFPDTITDENRHVLFPKKAEYKANKLKILLIFDKFINKKINEIGDENIKYKINNTLESGDINFIYYKSIKRAFYKDLIKYNNNYSGIYIEWLDNGYQYYKEEYSNGQKTSFFKNFYKKINYYSRIVLRI